MMEIFADGNERLSAEQRQTTKIVCTCKKT